MKRGIPIEEADRIVHEVEAQIHPGISPGYCVIHADPEEPASKPAPEAEPQETGQLA